MSEYRARAIAIVVEEMKLHEGDRSAALDSIRARINDDKELYVFLTSPSLDSIITALMREVDAHVRQVQSGAPVPLTRTLAASKMRGSEALARGMLDVVFYGQRLGDWTVRTLREETSGARRRLATETMRIEYLEAVCNLAVEYGGDINTPFDKFLTQEVLNRIPPPMRVVPEHVVPDQPAA